MLTRYLDDVGARTPRLELKLRRRRALPARVPGALAGVRGRGARAAVSRLSPPARAKSTAPARLQGGGVPRGHGARAGRARQSLRRLPRSPGDGARAARPARASFNVMNPRLVRGLDYYCRTAFEVIGEGLGAQNAVGGGGRYDAWSRRWVAPRPGPRLRARPGTAVDVAPGEKDAPHGPAAAILPLDDRAGRSRALARNPPAGSGARRGTRARGRSLKGAAAGGRPSQRPAGAHPGRRGAARRPSTVRDLVRTRGSIPSARARHARTGARGASSGDARGRGGRSRSSPSATGDGRASCGVLRATDVCDASDPLRLGHARRDHGGVLFLDLRDRSGLVQAVCNPTESAAAHGRAGEVRLEYVVAVRGTVPAPPRGHREPRSADR